MLPEIGDLPLAEVRARDIVDLFHKLRIDRERNLAQRTIYNIYTVVAALFWDAKFADLVEQTPCILDERHSSIRIPSGSTQRCSRAKRSRRSSPSHGSRLIARWLRARVPRWCALRGSRDAKTTKTEAVKHIPVHAC